jgi:hypothetical protein
MFLLPFASVVHVDDNSHSTNWKSMYLVEDLTSLLFYLPFAVLWTAYLINKRMLNAASFKILIGIAALATFIVSFLSLIMISQDYEPYIGVIVSLLLFPLFVIFVINQGLLLKTKQNAS